MTGYAPTDLSEGWEFKILRSATGAFENPGRLRQVVADEARAGWVLIEKFDSQRLRFKRPVSARVGDAALGFDPYRTTYGISEGKLAFTIVGSVLGFLALILLIIFIIKH